MKKKDSKICTAEDLFNAIPGVIKESSENLNNINNINKTNEDEEQHINEKISDDIVDGVFYEDYEVKDKYICSQIHDQGLTFVVNDGDKSFAKCIIVLPEYSNIMGDGNKYLSPDKKYTYVLSNEVNLKTMKRRVSARVIETDEFEAETGIDVSKYFTTQDNIEKFADEISEHINLVKQCSSKDTLRTVVLEIMRRALHP